MGVRGYEILGYTYIGEYGNGGWVCLMDKRYGSLCLIYLNIFLDIYVYNGYCKY